MSHIVIDARIINSSTGRYVERLLHYLQEIDQENNYTILIPSKDLDFWKPRKSNFKIKACDFRNYSFGEQIGMKKLLDELKPDLVHFCMPQQPIFYRGKTVTTFHDLTLLKTWNTDKNWLVFHVKQLVGRLVFKIAAQKSTQIITPSDFTSKELIEFGPKTKNKITRTYEGADIITATPEEFNLPFSRFLLYVGQQSDYKNIPFLAESHQNLLAKYPDLGLVLVGSLNKSAKKNQQDFVAKNYQNIHFTGFVTDEELAWLYKNAACYVFPSKMEGFGLPGLEAMAYKTPLISSDATCLPEVYGDAARYFNPKNHQELENQILDCLENPRKTAELVEKGTARHTSFSWRKMAKETLEVYQKALRK